MLNGNQLRFNPLVFGGNVEERNLQWAQKYNTVTLDKINKLRKQRKIKQLSIILLLLFICFSEYDILNNEKYNLNKSKAKQQPFDENM